MIADNEVVLNNFLTWFRAGHSPASVSSYKYALYPFRKWLDEQSSLEGSPHLITTLTFERLLAYLEHLHQADLKPNTRAIYITALKGLYKWLNLQERSPINPDLIPTVPIDPSASSRNAATQEEVEAILGTFDEYFPEDLRTKAAISLLWDSGMRLGELLSLDIESIDTQAMRGRVKTYKRKNHSRTIRWWHGTNEVLKRWLVIRDAILRREGVKENAVFISLSSNSTLGRLDRHVIQKAMREACDELSITRQISPHTLRHGNLTLLLRGGMNIRQVQEHAGHAKVTTTQIYTHVDEGEIDRHYRRIQEERYTQPRYGNFIIEKPHPGLRSDGQEGWARESEALPQVALPSPR